MSEDPNAQGGTGGQGDTGSGGDGQGQQGGDGQPATPSFRDSLPEAIRAHEALKDIADGPTLAQKYLDLVQAAPVVPETPDAYQIPIPSEAPIHPDALKVFRDGAHKAKLTQEQVQELGTVWDGYIKGQVEKEAAIRVKAETDLKTAWGNDYEANLDLSKKALAKLGTPELVDHLEKSGLGNHPEMVKLFHKLGTAISEDSLATGVTFGSGTIQRSLGGEPLFKYPSMETK